MRRILLIAATTGYQTRAFAEEARRLGLDLVLATDRCHVLEDPWGDDAIAIRFEDPSAGIESLTNQHFDGIVAVGDTPAYVASQAAATLGLQFSAPNAVLASKHKFLARERFRESGLPSPGYRLVNLSSDPGQAAAAVRYPCVLKPLNLSASRGVIRANTESEFKDAFTRIQKMLRAPESSLLVEDYIPGLEFALEGLVTAGKLQVLALFDKPDPLDGPYFEETIYITPSHQPASIQQTISDTVQSAITALGLTFGPVHAEMRVNPQGVWMLEVAARPIGGLCSRVLRFDESTSLEEVILRHALGDDVSKVRLTPGAHGVMMIPIPHAGVYSGTDGLENARAVAGIEDVIITAKEGQTLVPLPEGASYLGFIFARGKTFDAVNQALRESHACLGFRLSGVLPVVR